MTNERKLVTYRTIKAITPLVGADKIELATVDGWRSIVSKGEFEAGQKVLYFEYDTFLPMSDSRYSHLMKNTVFLNGVEGVRLRTMEFKRFGVISQGLIMDPNKFPELIGVDPDSLTEALNLSKWQDVLPTELVGRALGYMPSFIKKTSLERIQNRPDFIRDNLGKTFEGTVKLNGASCTVYDRNWADPLKFVELGVCTAEVELAKPDDGVKCTYWDTVISQDLRELITFLGGTIALQGEIIGPFNGRNHENVEKNMFVLFRMYDMKESRILTPDEVRENIELFLEYVPFFAAKNVKVVMPVFRLTITPHDTIDELIALANGPGMFGRKTREGIVLRNIEDGNDQIKILSDKYLAKEK